MNHLSWIIPVLLGLFVLGKIAEILRAMRGSLDEDISFLRAGLADVQRRCQALHDEAPLPDHVRSRVRSRLAEARRTLQVCDRNLVGASRLRRTAMRPRVKKALKLVGQARVLLSPYMAAEFTDENDPFDRTRFS